MKLVLPFIIPLLLIFAIIASGLFLIRAWNNRSESLQAPYNVGRQEASVAMQINVVRALFVIVIGTILLAVLLLSRTLRPLAAEEPLLEAQPSPTIVATAVPVIQLEEPTAQPTQAIPPSPTAVEIDDTATATVRPSPTPTVVSRQETAVVSSGVGVWLRASPSLESEQLEWLLEGTTLILLDGSAEADSFTWQQVQAPSGEAGWVATEFIVLPES